MVGATSTNRLGNSYRYYTCLSRRRKRHNCSMLGIQKEVLENFVFQKVWEMIYDNNDIDKLINDICKKHKSDNEENEVIKSLEKKRADALKSSNNLIAAIEQGFLTEQTKLRLKELENQITQYDFDIEQAKQRNYSYLTPELVKNYFKEIFCGDINEIEIRKYITRLFIREVILYNDKIVITFNFTEKNLTLKTIPDKIEEIENIIKNKSEMTGKNTAECVFECSNTPPIIT